MKNLLQFTFEKINLLCKKTEKNNLSRGKIPAPPPGYQMVRPLIDRITTVALTGGKLVLFMKKG